MNSNLSLIGEHEVFAELDTAELKSLSAIIENKSFPEGAVIFDMNQTPRFLFYIKQGRLLLKLANNEYKTLTTGHLFGEIGLLNTDFRTGMITAIEPTEVIQICGTRLFKEEFISPTVALKVVRALSKRITNYLRTKEQISTKEIIAHGETDHVEFKSTLRWNLYTKAKDKAMEKAILKTLAAFMNTDGGTLLVGVSDDGTILGLEEDQFENNDKILLYLTSIIKDRIDALHLKFLHFSIEQINDKDILRIDCAPGSIPAYVTDGKLDHFYIRTGPATTDMRLSEVYEYLKERFYNY